jgi:Protein of unknown function (DUF3551)
MRLLILPLILANAALMGATDPGSAQSPNSYPWCSRPPDRSSANNCYFTSKEQCQRTSSGIGVLCFENPSYRPSPAARDKANPRRPRHP